MNTTYYYGHGSWIAIVVFFGFITLRVISSQRRRHARPASPRARSFTQQATPAPPVAASDDAPPSQVTFTGIAPGWLVDPSGRHDQRYWSGSEWTEHVLDGGVPGTDPPPTDPRREASS